MKSKTDQLDFDFSRPIDFQRNISSEIIDDCVSELLKDNKNSLFKKHLKILILELFYCWIESDKQFLTVSMSKRGYNSKSRYNPNNISSYLIKVVNLLVKNNLINFHAGFYDTRTKKSRLTRIKSSKILISQFEKIKLLSAQGVNHRKKEYLLIYNKGKLYEYKDSYDTQEIRVVLENYNKIISKTLFDIPSFEEKILVRGDNKKITISPFSSIFYKKEVEKLDEGLIGGCWWNMIDLHLFLNIKNKLTINNKKTSYLDLTNYFANYLSLISNSNISIQQKSFSKVLGYDQLCYLIMKGFRSKTSTSFLNSVFREKKKFSLQNFTSNEIDEAIKNHIINNQKLEKFLYKGKDIGWDFLVSKIFFKLISEITGIKIPVFLVRDKIYFPTDKESLIFEKLEKILFNELHINNFKLHSEKASDFTFEKRNFFGRLVKSNVDFSKRYLDNKKLFGVE